MISIADMSPPEDSIIRSKREDARRYQWLANYLCSDDTSLDDEIVEATNKDKAALDAVIDKYSLK